MNTVLDRVTAYSYSPSPLDQPAAKRRAPPEDVFMKPWVSKLLALLRPAVMPASVSGDASEPAPALQSLPGERVGISGTEPFLSAPHQHEEASPGHPVMSRTIADIAHRLTRSCSAQRLTRTSSALRICRVESFRPVPQ